MAKAKKEEAPIRVFHIMADGTRRTDEEMNGYVIPVNEYTKEAYRILAMARLREARRRAEGAG